MMKWPGSILKLLAVAAIALGATELPVTVAHAGTNFDPGSLAYHLSTNAARHARGHSGIDMLELSNWVYAEYSGTNLAFLTNAVWSTNFWLHGVRGLSATPIGFSNSLGGQGLVTMVSPRHYLFASHMGPQHHPVAFLATNNVIHWRTTLQRADVTNDISVGILNADLPPSVGFLPVAPANLQHYLPTNGFVVVQGIGMNQDMRLFSLPMNFGNPAFVYWDGLRTVPFGLGPAWYVGIRGGDSSNPDMLLIGNQLVLVSHNYTGNSGPSYASQIAAINQKMHYLSTNNHVRSDYQLTEFSLTNWPVVQ